MVSTLVQEQYDWSRKPEMLKPLPRVDIGIGYRDGANRHRGDYAGDDALLSESQQRAGGQARAGGDRFMTHVWSVLL